MRGKVAKRIRKMVWSSDPKLFLVLRNLLGSRSAQMETMEQIYKTTKKNWRKIRNQLEGGTLI